MRVRDLKGLRKWLKSAVFVEQMALPSVGWLRSPRSAGGHSNHQKRSHYVANDKMNPNPNQGTSERDQSKQAGQTGSASTGGCQGEQSEFSKDRQEKSAIGGAQGQNQDQSKTGEPGRARSELDQKNPSDSTIR